MIRYANHAFMTDAEEEFFVPGETPTRDRKKDYSRGRANGAQRRRSRGKSTVGCGIGARRRKRCTW